MAGPITWQSIRTTAGEPADAMRPLAGAQQSFNGVFDGLQNILNQRLAVEQSNNGAVQDAYKQNYLDQLQGAKTPEELAALQPTLEQARAALSPTNRAAVRGADEARTAGLRQQVTAGQAYDAGQVAYDAIPLKDRIAALAAEGKGPEAMELAKTLPERAGRAEVMSGVAKAQLTFNQTQRGEKLAEATTPNLIEEQRLKQRLFPVTAANAEKRASVDSATLDTQGVEAGNAVLDRQIAAATTAAAQKSASEQLVVRQKQGDVAKKLGLGVDPSGAPDLGSLSKWDRTRLTAAITAAGLPDPFSTLSGDTASYQAHMRTLQSDPRFTPESLARNQTKIAGAFNTVMNGAPVGNDALARATAQAQADVVQKERDARNRYAPNSPDALNAYENLAQTIKAELPDNVKEDLPALQNMLSKFATKGLEVRPGVFITPSVTDIMGEIRGYDKWNFLNATQARDIEANLKKTLGGSDVTELLKQTEESRIANRQRDVRAILNPLTPAVQPLNPLQLPVPQKK